MAANLHTSKSLDDNAAGISPRGCCVQGRLSVPHRIIGVEVRAGEADGADSSPEGGGDMNGIARPPNLDRQMPLCPKSEGCRRAAARQPIFRNVHGLDDDKKCSTSPHGVDDSMTTLEVRASVWITHARPRAPVCFCPHHDRDGPSMGDDLRGAATMQFPQGG